MTPPAKRIKFEDMIVMDHEEFLALQPVEVVMPRDNPTDHAAGQRRRAARKRQQRARRANR